MALTACTISGVPDRTQPDEEGGQVAELPMPPDLQMVADQFAVVRGWDLCAMHDIPAATRITGWEPRALLPNPEDGCDLTLGAPDRADQWGLTIEVTRLLRPDERRPAEWGTPGAPITVDGVQLSNVVNRADSCAYDYPLVRAGAESWGIQISWGFDAGGFEAKPPCDVVRDYVTALGSRLTDPPLRSAGLTTPALTLAELDPCAVVAAVLTTVSGETALTAENTVVRLSTPRECRASLSTGMFKTTDVEVAFGIDHGGLSTTGTVAGRPAELEGGSWIVWSCRATFQATDVELSSYSRDKFPSVEIMTIEFSVCEHVQQLTAVAERAEQLVPPPRENPDAQPLGALDP